MRSRSISNDDALVKIKKPVLITHGVQDNVVLISAVMHTAKLIPHASISFYDEVGHSPFWENTIRFNDELKYFIKVYNIL